MSIAFDCPHCEGRIQTSGLAPGQLAHCGKCGEKVVVPRELEPPLHRDKVQVLAGQRFELSGWKGRLLAGLVPSAFMFLGLAMFLMRFGNIMIVVAPLVANPIIGVIVGQSVARRRFVYGMGVAVAGWILSLFVGVFIFGFIVPLVIGHVPEGAEASGLGMFVGLVVMFGALASPIAGIASLVVAVISGGAGGRTYMSHSVTEMPFTLAGGQIVSLPVTDAGPLPAENDLVKIEVAGFRVEPASDSSGTSALVWNFAFSSKRRLTLETVAVEQVYPDSVGVEIVNDTTPLLTKGRWRGDAEPLLLTEASTPWLFESGTSIFVFKITIKAKGHEAAVLYQPSWYSEA